ncbi:toll/interleukin-1 receptor domain-containing protein [Caulobacter segnis]
MDGDQAGAARYRAFISYNHRDAVFGRRLHAVERYVLPRRLVGRETPRGKVPRRLTPIFRDREELPAAHDLTVEVRAALATSNALIVVCTPNAAASPWVAREIQLFRALHPDRPILAALAEGEPAEAFPAPLREGHEPLAADFRPTGDGARLALLKLVAGVAGVGLDEVVQRDAQRRLRSVTRRHGRRAGGGARHGAAHGIRPERAGRSRTPTGRVRVAGGIHDDRPAGEIDADPATGRAERGHPARPRLLCGQDPTCLALTSLARRARVLRALAEDGEGRGDLATANARIHEAYAISSRLLAAEPDNPQRLYDQAQNEYWLATLAYRKDRLAEARAGYARYRDLAGRLTRIRPDSIEYRQELGYAEGNLCTVAVDASDKAASARHCAESLRVMQDVDARMVEARRRQATNLINRRAWMSEAYKVNGDIERAIAERAAEEKILDVEMAPPPRRSGPAGPLGGAEAGPGRPCLRLGRRRTGARLPGRQPRARRRTDRLRRRQGRGARALLARIDNSIAYVKQNPAPRRRK